VAGPRVCVNAFSPPEPNLKKWGAGPGQNQAAEKNKAKTPSRRAARLSKTAAVALIVRSDTGLSYADVIRTCCSSLKLEEYGIRDVRLRAL